MNNYKVILGAPNFTVDFFTADIEKVKKLFLNKKMLQIVKDKEIVTIIDLGKFYTIDIREATDDEK